MKKMFRCLFALLGSATLLAGCSLDDLLSIFNGSKETAGIRLADYSKEAVLSSEYAFDGKVFLQYSDNTETEVTKDCKFTTLDTSKVGDSTFKVSYEAPKKIYTNICHVQVLPYLNGIDITNYKASYTVNQAVDQSVKVTALYLDQDQNSTQKDVSSSATVDFSGINTSEVGTYQIRASYTEFGITKEAAANVTVADVLPKLQKIEASDYTSKVNKNEKYTFDGKVMATFDDGNVVDVTDDCSFASIITSSTGNKSLKITYKDPNYSTNTKTCTITITVESRVTGISVSDSLKVKLNSTTSLNASVLPTDATNKGLTYKSNNTSIATVDSSGNVTGVALGTTTIVVTAQENAEITKNVSIEVSETANKAWTILLYLCGSSLESGSDYGGIQYGGAATSDIQEILSVNGQPSDVNFVIQTGGASQWKTTYDISASYNQRYHVENRQLVKDNNKVYTSYKGMGESDTLKDFLVWGIDTYPADKIGVILWNHGGGLDGVCYDEKDSNDNLTDNEVVTAVSGALNQTGLSKLEFIGYDACLMQMMEIAEFNAPYFNYQIASQESEAGSGWDYDTWVDDLYAKKSTETILQAIVDGFIEDNGGVNYQGTTYQGEYYAADQTLSYLDLSKVSEFKTAWEALATQVKSKVGTSSTNKSNFKNNVVGASKYFAGDDYTYYAEFDCYDFLTHLEESDFAPSGNYISNARTALGNLVKYNLVQLKDAGDAHGLSFYFGKTYNSSTYSHFTNWVSLCSTVGGFQSSGGWW